MGNQSSLSKNRCFADIRKPVYLVFNGDHRNQIVRGIRRFLEQMPQAEGRAGGEGEVLKRLGETKAREYLCCNFFNVIIGGTGASAVMNTFDYLLQKHVMQRVPPQIYVIRAGSAGIFVPPESGMVVPNTYDGARMEYFDSFVEIATQLHRKGRVVVSDMESAAMDALQIAYPKDIRCGHVLGITNSCLRGQPLEGRGSIAIPMDGVDLTGVGNIFSKHDLFSLHTAMGAEKTAREITRLVKKKILLHIEEAAAGSMIVASELRQVIDEAMLGFGDALRKSIRREANFGRKSDKYIWSVLVQEAERLGIAAKPDSVVITTDSFPASTGRIITQLETPAFGTDSHGELLQRMYERGIAMSSGEKRSVDKLRNGERYAVGVGFAILKEGGRFHFYPRVPDERDPVSPRENGGWEWDNSAFDNAIRVACSAAVRIAQEINGGRGRKQ